MVKIVYYSQFKCLYELAEGECAFYVSLQIKNRLFS